MVGPDESGAGAVRGRRVGGARAAGALGAARAAFGALVAWPALVHDERRNGVCRDRLNALTRTTHAFAKTAPTWDALLDLHGFEQNWVHPRLALRASVVAVGHRHDPRAPAMALRLTDHGWSWRE